MDNILQALVNSMTKFKQSKHRIYGPSQTMTNIYNGVFLRK